MDNDLTRSPCIGTCSTIRGDDVCVGCYRTVDEIMLWHKMTDQQKIAINQRINKEKNIHNTTSWSK